MLVQQWLLQWNNNNDDDDGGDVVVVVVNRSSIKTRDVMHEVRNSSSDRNSTSLYSPFVIRAAILTLI